MSSGLLLHHRLLYGRAELTAPTQASTAAALTISGPIPLAWCTVAAPQREEGSVCPRTVAWIACVLVSCLAMACKKDSSSDARDEGPARGPKGDAGALHPQIETAKQVVQWLAAGEAAPLRETFDKAMLKAFPDDAAIAKWWQDAVKQTGRLRKQLSATQKTDGKFTSVIVTCVFANAPQDVLVLFNKRGQVAGLKVSVSTNPDVRL